MQDEDRLLKEQRAKQLEDDRQAKQVAYAKKLKAVKGKIDSLRQVAKDQQDEAMRQQILNQRRQELEKLKQENLKSTKKLETQNRQVPT
jgi:G:T/U-mismatch repair DNA glycosylase